MMNTQNVSSNSAGTWNTQPKAQLVTDHMQSSAIYTRTRNFLIVFGVLILSLIIATPVWDACRLLGDSTVVFFIGEKFANASLTLCCASIGVWIVLVFLFFRCSREEGLTELSVTNLTIIVLAGLGLGMLLISVPAVKAAQDQYDDLLGHCGTSTSTAELAAYSSVLQELRQTPDCANLDSVEDCQGYEASNPYTGFLKSMEAQFRCAGFCYTPQTADESSTAASNQEASTNSTQDNEQTQPSMLMTLRDRVLRASFKSRAKESHVSMQEVETRASEVLGSKSWDAIQSTETEPAHKHEWRKRSPDHEPGIFLLSADEEMSRVDANANSASGSNDNPSTYPPTLFSLANYQASCDGMAARNIKYTAEDAARYLYYEGITLIGVSVLVGMFKMCHLSAKARRMGY